MKKMALYVRILYLIFFLMTLVFFFLSPSSTLNQFKEGTFYSYPHKDSLFLFSFITIITGEVSILWSKWYRKKANLREFPILLETEKKFIQSYSVMILIFIFVIFQKFL